MIIKELHYSSTNTYLISGTNGLLLFDTGWAGTFRAFCRAMGEIGIPVQQISCILISHYHPDHCGIAQEIADCGSFIAVMDVQREFVHSADAVLMREPEKGFCPIDDEKIRLIDLADSREFLSELGIDGEILAVPGHSDDSIALCLDDGSFFVGDLNPLYELEMHRGTTIGESWNRLLARHPKTVYYGHARTAYLEKLQDLQPAGEQRTAEGQRAAGDQRTAEEQRAAGDQRAAEEQQTAGKQKTTGKQQAGDADREYTLVRSIMKYTDKGLSAAKIQKKTGASEPWIKDVMRMYLTHQNISVQGILDRLEIRNR